MHRTHRTSGARPADRPPSTTTRRAARWLLTAAASLLLTLTLAPETSAQASRSRPPEHSSGGSVQRSSPPSTSSSSGSHPSGSSASSPAGQTRPGTADGSKTTITRDRRGPRGRDGGTIVVRDPYPYGWGWGWWGSPGLWGWGGWGWGGWYGPGPYGGGYYGVPWYTHRARDNMGAFDLDLKPGDTQIYLEGQMIGTADRFDGWPQYLWLEEGDYHLVFFREGYRTISRQYKVFPGVVIDVEDQLERGESTPPGELLPPPHERRDARIRRNQEQRRRVEQERREPAWRERGRDQGGDDYGDRDGDFGSVRLRVTPDDASVYLDGRFIGTGEDLARLRGGLAVEAGEHTLSVVRPGRLPDERDFAIDAGETVDLEIELEEAD